MSRFIGRKKELRGLKELLQKKSASLVVIKGRRRIGKTTLAEEFGKEFRHRYFFSGLAPSQAGTMEAQKKEFLRQMQRGKIRSLGDSDWGSLFEDVAAACKKGRVLIVLDEISWMGTGDPTFLAKLKNAWDLHFKKNSHLILIISGSNSTWIEKNLLSDTGFVGRISYRLNLEELPLHECKDFWGIQNENISSFDKLKTLSVTGGVPRYLEEIEIGTSAEANIQRLCFQPEGLLVHEFEDIFADSLSKKSAHYKTIVKLLAQTNGTHEEVAKSIGRARSAGDVTEYLEDLCSVGFVSRDYTWDLESGKESKKSIFRLRDNYLRFYLRYIEPHRQKILNSTMQSLPKGWDSIMGLQFENLVLSKNNRLKLYELLNIPLDSIVQANPYFQTQTTRRQKCQIDFLIQTKEGSLYVCEIKFTQHPVEREVMSEIQEKIARLKRPKHTSCRPVLIHVNGLGASLQQSDYFVKTVNFGDFLS